MFTDGEELTADAAAPGSRSAPSRSPASAQPGRRDGQLRRRSARGGRRVCSSRRRFAQRAPFAEQLGLTLNPSGCVEVDAFGRTSLPGVHAAGDMAHLAALPMPVQSVVAAAASGQTAAASLVAFALV